MITMIDLDNEEHCAALAWACIQVERKTNMARELLGPPPKYSTHVERAGLWEDRENAIRAISSSVSAAELIRALVERAGLRVIGFRETSSFPFASVEARGDGAIAIEVIHVPMAMAQWATAVAAPQIPPTIARLLALEPGAGADAVLAALRGE